MLTVDQVANFARLKAAETLAHAVDGRLAGIASRDDLQAALHAYWATVPQGPDRPWNG